MLCFEPSLFELSLFHAVKTLHSLSSKTSIYKCNLSLFCSEFVMISSSFSIQTAHGIVFFESRRQCLSEFIGYCFPSLVALAYQENTELSLISYQIVHFLEANRAPGFARFKLLPNPNPLLAILRQEEFHWKH